MPHFFTIHGKLMTELTNVPAYFILCNNPMSLQK